MPKNSDFIISTLIVVLFQNFSCIAWPQAATSRAAPPALRSRHVLMTLPAPWKATTHKRIQQKGQALKDTVNRLRISLTQATNAVGSVHTTSCCRAVHMVAELFFHAMRYKDQDPSEPS